MDRRFRIDGRTTRLGLSSAIAVAAGAFIVRMVLGTRAVSGRRGEIPACIPSGQGFRVERTVTVLHDPAALYPTWRDLTSWAEVVPGVRSVVILDARRAYWRMTSSSGGPLAWEGEIVADEPDRFVAWHSAADSDSYWAGSVDLSPAPGGRGTEVRLTLTYLPPADRLYAGASNTSRSQAERQVREGLRRFKQRMEAREIPVSAASRAAAARG
jgi:uncharacterized membrane protein